MVGGLFFFSFFEPMTTMATGMHTSDSREVYDLMNYRSVCWSARAGDKGGGFAFLVAGSERLVCGRAWCMGIKIPWSKISVPT